MTFSIEVHLKTELAKKFSVQNNKTSAGVCRELVVYQISMDR